MSTREPDLLALLISFWSTMFLVVSIGTRGIEGFTLFTIAMILVFTGLVRKSLQESEKGNKQ